MNCALGDGSTPQAGAMNCAPTPLFQYSPSLYSKCIVHKERPNDDLLAFMQG